MATRIQYSDIKYGFEKLSSGDISLVTNENSINQSLKTLFMTIRGERFFNADYGTNIKRKLFEPLDRETADSLVNDIKDSISIYEGARIEILDINININHDKNAYEITIIYGIKSTTETGEFNITLNRG